MIKVLASGSKGNCYLIKTKKESLILELGIGFREILKGLNFNLNDVVGCLVSHKHKDHSRSIVQAVKRGLDVYCNEDVANGVKDNRRINIIEPLKKLKIGNFTILPFDCQHTNSDGAECPNLGFLIQHKELGKIIFVTDTYYLKYTFSDVDHILIECNYTERDLDNLPSYRLRVLKSHMSLEILKDTLKTWGLSSTKDITLIHLSEINGDNKYFKEEMEKATGCLVNIAIPKLKIE